MRPSGIDWAAGALEVSDLNKKLAMLEDFEQRPSDKFPTLNSAVEISESQVFGKPQLGREARPFAFRRGLSVTFPILNSPTWDVQFLRQFPLVYAMLTTLAANLVTEAFDRFWKRLF